MHERKNGAIAVPSKPYTSHFVSQRATLCPPQASAAPHVHGRQVVLRPWGGYQRFVGPGDLVIAAGWAESVGAPTVASRR